MESPMKILNDIHVGFKRKMGTTPSTQEALRGALMTVFESWLYDSPHDPDLLIAGDLFDDFEVDPRDWIDAYLLLQDFMVRTGGTLTLMAGNHDWSPKGERKSSFEMLAVVLREQFGDKVTVIGIDDFFEISGRVWALAHCSNQEVFNTKLKQLLDVATQHGVMSHLFLHCNYDNKFAARTDHSLNLSVEVAREFTERGVQIIIAHEHQAKTALGGKLVIMGNQFPTSIADCLGNSEKFLHILDDGELKKYTTWSEESPVLGYTEVEWQMLKEGQFPCGFIRVIGEAVAAQASEVVSTIATFRAKSDAFVITNAVKIEGMAEVADLPEQFEVARKFEVLDFIKKNLDAAEFVVVEKLVKEMQ